MHQAGIVADEESTARQARGGLGHAEPPDQIDRAGQRGQQRGRHRAFRLAGPGEHGRDRAEQRAARQRAEQRRRSARPARSFATSSLSARARRRAGLPAAVRPPGHDPRQRSRPPAAAAGRARAPRQAGRSCDRAAGASPRGRASAPSRQSSSRGYPPRGPTACRPHRPKAAASAGGRATCRARWSALGSACARTRPRPLGRRRR